MKAADRLGTGSSFGNMPRGRSARGRAKAITQGDVPIYELVRLRLTEVAPTPLNPRRNFGTDEQKTRFGEELRTAQLAACVAVSRDTYLDLWPDHTAKIGDAAYVLVNGERRYRSAEHVGLESLDFVVRDDLASSREDFIDNLLKENLDREDFDVIERARGVQQLVDVCAEESETGSRTRAAKRLGRDRSWVTNQIALLTLPDEIQTMLSAGSMSERDGRLTARHAKDNPHLAAADLVAFLKATRQQEAVVREQQKAILQAARETPQTVQAAPPVLSADNTDSPAGIPEDSSTVLSADNTVHATTPSAPSGKNGATGTEPKPQPGSQVLSADNKTEAASLPHQTAPSTPSSVVIHLTDTPQTQAKLLAENLSSAGLTALVEELHHHL
ncbi:ParB/RepB/Spo0J family partition protein [Streptomyces sp. NPDC090053]|uniref:ParB/RepB/Spo0J family partition protein n=1 Tax=Streptomyces sp. NPDC090053 TaxID=3365932 RepID=UPI00381C6735